jgi:gluconolactonase
MTSQKEGCSASIRMYHKIEDYMANSSIDRPVTIQAQEWTSLPVDFRQLGISENPQNQKRGKPLNSFLEGPIYVVELDLLFVANIPYSHIFAIDSNAQWSLKLVYNKEPNGLVWNHISKKIITEDFKHGILEFDPASKMLRARKT